MGSVFQINTGLFMLIIYGKKHCFCMNRGRYYDHQSGYEKKSLLYVRTGNCFSFMEKGWSDPDTQARCAKNIWQCFVILSIMMIRTAVSRYSSIERKK